MDIKGSCSIYRWAYAVFFLSGLFLTSKANVLHQETVLCPQDHRKYPFGPCNTLINCRFGGQCRKVAYDSSGRGITRYVIPKGSSNREPSSRSRASVVQESGRATQHTDAEFCYCSFKCEPRNAREVCGTNGITYRSACHLRRYSCRCQTSVRVHYRGLCKQDIATHRESSSSSKDLLPMRDCSRKCNYGGRCDDQGRCQCNIDCLNVISFVCGNDGKTYKNDCFLRLAQCEEQRGITILNQGPCSGNRKHRRGVPVCHRRCNSQDRNPVCGSDDVTYTNECFLKQESCTTKQRIRVKHVGACGEQSRVVPSPTPDPCRDIECTFEAVCVAAADPIVEFMCSCDAICSEDTKRNDNYVRLSVGASPTEKSKWAMGSGKSRNRGNRRKGRKRHNRNRRRHRSKRSIDGLTAPQNTTLCGTDGKTYKNLCEMKTYACHQQTNISVRHVGACPMVLPTTSTRITPDRAEPDIVVVPSDESALTLHSVLFGKRKGVRRHHRTGNLDARKTVTRAAVRPTTAKYRRLTPTVDYAALTIKETSLSESYAPRRLHTAKITAEIPMSNPTGLRLNISLNIDPTVASSPSSTTTGSFAKSQPELSIKVIASQQSKHEEQTQHGMVNHGAKSSNRTSELFPELQNQQSGKEKGKPPPCDSVTATPTLQWYHVVLVVVGIQLFVIIALVIVCAILKRRRRSKQGESSIESNDSSVHCRKDGNDTESEKT